MNRIIIISLVIIALGSAAIWGIFNGGYFNDGGPATINPPSNNSTSTNSTSTTTTPPVAVSPTPPPTTPAPNPPPPATPNPPPPPPPPPTNPGPTPSEIVYANRSKQQVVFTFDGGGGTTSHAQILAVLAKHGVKGTYFITGNFAKSSPSALAQIAAAGHEVFNHSVTHPDFTTLSNDQIRYELREADRLISNVTGKSTKPFFRPPLGARNPRVYDVVWSEGYRGVYWSMDTLDWQTTATRESIKQRVYNGLTPGAVYLMHVGAAFTGDILDEVFTEIKSRGYSIVSLTEGLR